jgi:hydrogenase maturation protease
MTGAALGGENPRGEHLRGEDLRGADITGADLTGGNLTGGDPGGGDPSGGDPGGVDLTGVDLDGMSFWSRMGSRGPDRVEVDGVRLVAGSRVRLCPRQQADIFDLALAGRTAVVESIEQDAEGRIHLAVTVPDDPGRDLGDARMPGHRFFYAVEDVQPLPPPDADAGPGRVLVAGIGNIFLGDDGFGCEVARRLAAGPDIPGVDVVDFGIRGMDLVYALARGYSGAVLVDAAPRGYAPGTLTVVRPDPVPEEPVCVQTHGMDPVRVLALAREFGGIPARTYVVGCEPGAIPVTGPDEEVVMALSPPVLGAVDAAVGLVRSLAVAMVADPDGKGGEVSEDEAVDRGTAGCRHGRDGGDAVAGDPAVPEDAADVTAARVPDGRAPGRETADVPGHSG